MSQIAFKFFPKELKGLALASIGSIDTREALSTHLSSLSNLRLVEFCERLQLLSPPQGVTASVASTLAAEMKDDKKSLFAARKEAASASASAEPAVKYPAVYQSREFLYELIITTYERRLSQRQAVKNMSLYPPEVSV